MKVSVIALLQVQDLVDRLPQADQRSQVDQLLQVYQLHQVYQLRQAGQPLQALVKGKESLAGGAQTLTLTTQDHKILHQ